MYSSLINKQKVLHIHISEKIKASPRIQTWIRNIDWSRAQQVNRVKGWTNLQIKGQHGRKRYMLYRANARITIRSNVFIGYTKLNVYNCGGCCGGVAFSPNKLPEILLLEEALFLCKLLLADEVADGDRLPGIDCGKTKLWDESIKVDSNGSTLEGVAAVGVVVDRWDELDVERRPCNTICWISQEVHASEATLTCFSLLEEICIVRKTRGRRLFNRDCQHKAHLKQLYWYFYPSSMSSKGRLCSLLNWISSVLYLLHWRCFW